MCSGVGDRTCLLPGFPIRKSSDHSSVGSSPRLIAASYVLLRLLVPRHPPCALTNLATKMLASTVQFSNYGRSHSHAVRRLNWSDRGNGPAAVADGSMCPKGSLPQDSTACLGRSPTHPIVPTSEGRTELGCYGGRPNGQCSTPEHHPWRDRPWHGFWTTSIACRQVLLRKEVIQPHLPVRLPCYDFVPIAGPTFDSSLPKGLGHWLRVLPTFVT
jgi:hypothetical protein